MGADTGAAKEGSYSSGGLWSQLVEQQPLLLAKDCHTLQKTLPTAQVTNVTSGASRSTVDDDSTRGNHHTTKRAKVAPTAASFSFSFE